MSHQPLDYDKTLEFLRAHKCPLCGYDGQDIHNHGENFKRGYIVEKEMYCEKCRGSWSEYYDLTGLVKVHFNNEKTSEGVVEHYIRIENNLSDIEHWPEILRAILSQKQVLPVLLGIDDELDRIIEKELRNNASQQECKSLSFM